MANTIVFEEVKVVLRKDKNDVEIKSFDKTTPIGEVMESFEVSGLRYGFVHDGRRATLDALRGTLKPEKRAMKQNMKMTIPVLVDSEDLRRAFLLQRMVWNSRSPV
eukprot:CAMPEP_0206627418 /NCGR_PEP_ID=MMETSP0325_2-20121206/65939_1 /ASSEMBLY_ACC=CAM_ASM_000347 /TAXON_ID=2866 /ORGANISM="Crypthecodinium cohnii, Strain Seligo" /LENGTH=105 /DNA_ID=CAMNT_0054152029 /DNA_START=135 /DNA_END=452 /DNA_ORIENTATION=-